MSKGEVLDEFLVEVAIGAEVVVEVGDGDGGAAFGEDVGEEHAVDTTACGQKIVGAGWRIIS